jgi:hypothetical protein
MGRGWAKGQYKICIMKLTKMIFSFQGLVHTVVKQVLEREEPDFIMETHTAVVGVRGTDWYTLLGPSLTLVALKHGTLSVGPTVEGLAPILLQSMHYIQVPKPFVAKVLTPEMIKMLGKMMDIGDTSGELYWGQGLANGGEFPLQLPVNPGQILRMLIIPPKLLPTMQVTPHTPSPTPSPGPSPPSG